MASNFKSAFEAIPGRDALFEYEEKSYPIRTYVERNGLIFKSITATSENFVLSQWELVNDLREVRVPNIAARNSLTGTTGTSYGVHTPILDNTNVLVLDASADPEVGSAQFARYNYNQGSASWLLLQVGTGSTSATTSIEYSNVLNRPFVVSGVTINAGAGLGGGGSVFGSIPAAGGVISLNHADTSSQANVTPTGRTYVQQLRFDTFGHVTGATTSLWTHPDTSNQGNVLNTGRTYIQSISLDGDGHVVSLSSSPWTHPDTSTQANSVNAGNTFIQSIFLDGDGHVTGIGVGVASGGGGGGSPLRYNGDSGGALTMNSGATLTISGGTNITTQRTGNAANPGLKINLNPAGTVGQVQYNSSVGLGASANFVFNTVGNTLTVTNYAIGGTPASGTTGDQILSRNITTGVIQRLGIGTISNSVLSNLIANNGLNKIGNTVRLGGTLTGHTSIGGNTFDLTFTNRSITLGNRNAGTVGLNSIASGINLIASGASSLVIGNTNRVGLNSFALGSDAFATGQNSFAGGLFVRAFGEQSFAFGQAAHATASRAIAMGNQVLASGAASFAGGYANASFTNPVTSGGIASFNWSENAFNLVTDGAYGRTSVILGGRDHNIGTGGDRSVILGGDRNEITGGTTSSAILAGEENFIGNASLRSLVIGGRVNKFNTAASINSVILGGSLNTISAAQNNMVLLGGNNVFINTAGLYNEHAVAQNFAILNTPFAGGSDDVLTWNLTSKKIGKITQASLKSSPAGTNGSVQFRNASGNFDFNSGLIYSTGTSRLTTVNLAISTVPASGTTAQILTRNTSTGVVERIGLNAIAALPVNAIQYRTATGFGGEADFLYDPNFNAFTLGTRVVGSVGSGSVVIGTNSLASGANMAFAHGTLANATGNFSTAWGSVVTASGSVTFAGGANRVPDTTKPVLAAGDLSFNWSENDGGQTVGHGALAQNSAILGGRNHNIDASNQRSVILGGTGIKLTGSSYVDHVAVPNLAIFTTPSNGAGSDVVLTWSSTTKKVTKLVGAIGENLVAYVSPTGSDVTGTVGQMTKPFANGSTALAALKTAAGTFQKGIVKFLPGTYNLTGAAMNFDDYQNLSVQLDNATLNGGANTSSSICTTTAAVTTTVVNIFGNGTIVSALYTANPNANVFVNITNINGVVLSGNTINVDVMEAGDNCKFAGSYNTVNINRLIPANNRLQIQPVIHASVKIVDYHIDYTNSVSARGFRIVPNGNNANISLTVNSVNVNYADNGGFIVLPNHSFTNCGIRIHSDNCHVSLTNVLSRGIFSIDSPNTKIVISGRYIMTASSQPIIAFDETGLVTQPISVYVMGGTVLVTAAPNCAGRMFTPAGTRILGLLGQVISNKPVSGALTTSIGTLLVDANVV